MLQTKRSIVLTIATGDELSDKKLHLTIPLHYGATGERLAVDCATEIQTTGKSSCSQRKGLYLKFCKKLEHDALDVNTTDECWPSSSGEDHAPSQVDHQITELKNVDSFLTIADIVGSSKVDVLI